MREHLTFFRKSAEFKKYVFNTGWLLVDRVLKLIAGLLVGIYVARYLGPARYGLLNYAMSFVGLFTAFSTLGLDGIVIRELVKNENRRDELLGSAFWLKTGGAVLLFAWVMVAVQFTNSDRLTVAIVAVIAGGVLFDALHVIDFYFQARVQSKFVAMASVGALAAASCMKLALIFAQSELIWFAVVTVAEKALLVGGYVFYYYRNHLSPLRWRFNRQTALSLLKDSWPLILSGMSIMIYMRIDQILIKELLDSEAVGLYAVAVRLSEIWYFVPVTITASIFPAMLNAQTQKSHYTRRLQQLYDFMALVSIGVALVTTIAGKTLVLFLFGAAYAPAGETLIIHIWAGVFVSLGVANGKWLIAENLTRVSMINTMLGAMLNVGLNLWLIPLMGINGAAIATVISYFCSAYLFLLLNGRCHQNFKMLSKALFLPGGILRAFHQTSD